MKDDKIRYRNRIFSINFEFSPEKPEKRKCGCARMLVLHVQEASAMFITLVSFSFIQLIFVPRTPQMLSFFKACGS